jgi:iron(III) transport system ATP-binding protein
LSVSQPSAPSLNSRVLKAAYLGSHMEYTIETPLGPLFVIDPNVATPHAIGMIVHATLAPLGVTIIPN